MRWQDGLNDKARIGEMDDSADLQHLDAVGDICHLNWGVGKMHCSRV
jgi:hypothetical protein